MAIDKYKEELASGPQKPKKKGRPPRVFSSHKERAGWFQSREAWPEREAPVQILIRERTRVQRMLAESPGENLWESVGPTNIGGRMTSIVCHPDTAEIIWVGAAGGGIWKSEDAGMNWISLWHDQPTLNIGSLAIDPNNPDVLYCGTGEANFSADSHAGVGMYRSLDGGQNWQVLAVSDSVGIPERIGTIAIDPHDSNHILIGGVGYTAARPGGMYVSYNTGITWVRENFISSGNYWCHSIVFHPEEQGTIFATFTAFGFQNGIWRSRNGGVAWEHLTNGLPSSASIGRMSIAIAPSDPDVIYAISDDNNGRVLGVYRSDNAGDNWTEISGNHFNQERQMFYNNTIAIHPEDADHVICGGVDLHLTRNGGMTWRTVTRWWADRGESSYAHADHHALLMPAARPGWVYDMNDGGMDFSEDGGKKWSNRSNGLAVTMYYDLDVAQTDGDFFGGGTQDNGTLVTVNGERNEHFEILGGDGGWMTIDPADALHLYGSSQRMRIMRFRAQERWVDVSPLPENSMERKSMWMVFIAMDPSDTNIVYTGTQRVFKTVDDGDHWEAVSDLLDGSDITAIEIAGGDSTRVYVGTENGGIFRSLDSGQTWSPNIASTVLPGRTVTRIKTLPADVDSAVVTVANFGNDHVFLTRDGGLNWENIDQGQLPDVPHHSIAIRETDTAEIFVCNDAGVFISRDMGATWQNMTRNLPNVMVVDLVYHQHDRTLYAATYGRSIWRLQLD